MERPIHTKFNIWACIPTLNNNTKTFPHRSTGSGTSHGTSESHKNLYLRILIDLLLDVINFFFWIIYLFSSLFVYLNYELYKSHAYAT